MTRRSRSPFSAISGFLLALSMSACGADGSREKLSDAATPVDALGQEAEAAAPPRCDTGDVQPCVCATGGIGSSACIDGAFTGPCERCAEVDTPSGTLCVPGRYVGAYDVPKYYPTPAGLCGLITLYGGGGRGSWTFTLEGTGSAEFVEVVGAESCLVLDVLSADAGVGDGGVWSDAPEGFDAGTPSGPTKMALSGTVDCATGKFTGEVRGTYRAPSICNLGMGIDQYFMKGPVTATFDLATRSFIDGTVVIHEPPSLFPFGEPAGGSGTWEAALDDDAAVPPSADEDCLGGVTFQDFDIP